MPAPPCLSSTPPVSLTALAAHLPQDLPLSEAAHLPCGDGTRSQCCHPAHVPRPSLPAPHHHTWTLNDRAYTGSAQLPNGSVHPWCSVSPSRRQKLDSYLHTVTDLVTDIRATHCMTITSCSQQTADKLTQFTSQYQLEHHRHGALLSPFRRPVFPTLLHLPIIHTHTHTQQIGVLIQIPEAP